MIEGGETLKPCERQECRVCAFGILFADDDGGYSRRCVKSSKCGSFALDPKAKDRFDQKCQSKPRLKARKGK